MFLCVVDVTGCFNVEYVMSSSCHSHLPRHDELELGRTELCIGHSWFLLGSG